MFESIHGEVLLKQGAYRAAQSRTTRLAETAQRLRLAQVLRYDEHEAEHPFLGQRTRCAFFAKGAETDFKGLCIACASLAALTLGR